MPGAIAVVDKLRAARPSEVVLSFGIKLTAEVDAAVMGGAMVRIGDRVVDRTVRTLLQSVAAKLHEVSV